MVTLSPAAWSQAVLQSAREFGPHVLEVLEGAIPVGLRGSLYRNGPATLERGGQRVGHWFDGDGGILGIHFRDRTATGLYRYVQTAGYLQESKADQFLRSGYGMVAPGPWWQRFSKDLKNAANTSVLALPDRLLALWEGGAPHALDLTTLETKGLDDLGGLNGLAYSAHPKRDPKTGDLFNFSISFRMQGQLNLFRSDASGQLRQQAAVPLKGFPLVHDCAIAGRYWIFCVPPVRLHLWPVLAQLQSYSDALHWHPQEGTEIIVIDRDRLEVVSRIQTEAWYQWHFGNGYERPDGSVVIEIARYADFQTNQRLKEVATGETHTVAQAQFWQLRLDPIAGCVLSMQPLLRRSCEFPVTHPAEVGQPSRYAYLALHRSETDPVREVFDAIARFDTQTGDLMEADLGPHRYPSEPIYAPDAEQDGLGWILTVVYDGAQHQSEVWIYASDRLDQAPVCRLALPGHVPLSFHGTWHPA